MSLRARLLLATAVIALIALVGADVATYAAMRSSLYGQIDTTLELSHRAVESSISTAGQEARDEGSAGPSSDQAQPGPPASCPRFEGDTVDTSGLSPGTVIDVRSPAGRTVWHCVTPELDRNVEDVPVLPARITGLSLPAAGHKEPTVYFTASGKEGGPGFRVRASILAQGPARGGALIVAVPLTGTLGTLRNLEVVVTAAALMVVVILGWWLVRRSLRPLREVERTAAAIASGQLAERVPGDQARTEVGRVARALNVMLGRIQGAFAERDRTEADLRASEARMRQFVADASHELRTPLAAVSAYAELFDRGAASRPDDLRRVFHGIQHESARMARLVEDLLLLAHLDEGQAVHLEPVDLVALAADAVTTARAVGTQWPVVLRATHPVEVRADPLRLRQVFDNLIGNVRVHCPPGTTATVSVDTDETVATVTVCDDGPGLSASEQERIFERFFRADPSRSRLHGGAGLGLSIVAAIVRAHGGTVEVSSPPGGGACFTVRLPAEPSSGDVAPEVPDSQLAHNSHLAAD